MAWISKPKDRRPIVIRQYVPILGGGAILKHTHRPFKIDTEVNLGFVNAT